MSKFHRLIFSRRCVPDDKRAFASGVTYIIYKTIGLLPSPIIFGHIVDESCRLWQNICGRKGRCFDYDIVTLSRNITLFGLVVSGKSNLEKDRAVDALFKQCHFVLAFSCSALPMRFSNGVILFWLEKAIIFAKILYTQGLIFKRRYIFNLS